MASNLIILFAKAPIVGRVKTRLMPTISPEQAAELHRAFAHDMADRFRNIAGSDFELHTDMKNDDWASLRVTRKLQIPGDLGLKMVHALQGGLDAGYGRVIIVGSDAPTLPRAHVEQLLHSGCDVALGPATDGGFYAISASRVHEEMFDGVVWSRNDVTSRAIKSIRRVGLTVETGPEWFDVDEPEDLDRLERSHDLPAATAACLARLRSVQQGTSGCVRSED